MIQGYKILAHGPIIILTSATLSCKVSAMETTPLNFFLGHTLSAIEGAKVDNDVIVFTRDDGEHVKMYHEQDCCENVYVEDITGDISDLLGTLILAAYVTTEERDDAYTLWTFYHFRTKKGDVCIRWCGESEYYSVRVDLEYSLGVRFNTSAEIGAAYVLNGTPPHAPLAAVRYSPFSKTCIQFESLSDSAHPRRSVSVSGYKGDWTKVGSYRGNRQWYGPDGNLLGSTRAVPSSAKRKGRR